MILRTHENAWMTSHDVSATSLDLHHFYGEYGRISKCLGVWTAGGRQYAAKYCVQNTHKE